MPKVIFQFDKEKDLWNNWHKSNWKSDWMKLKIDSKIKKICDGKKLEDCREALSDYLSKLQNSEIINISLKSVENAWRNIEEEFFRRMNILMKNEFTDDISAYLTTVGICPYDPDGPSFMFSLFYSLPKALQTCSHEIMHLYFHRFYWKSTEDKIGKGKTSNLKEALTVLLNLEFRDLWFVKDQGYESHQGLRRFIEREWKKEKDFDVLMKKCTEFLK